MTPEQWQAAREVFEGALQVEPGKRDGWLAENCPPSAELQIEVKRLLAGHQHATDVFGRVQESLGASAVAGDLAGRRVGPYELCDAIGKGGMGVVYRAARVDAAFEKTVAIKLMGFEYADPEIERAFYKERQILAKLEHPHIARLLDGGTTADGLLYLVMELVDGEPIDMYCQHRELSIDARLALFEDVCSAVQHAHRNLIVHRDLKPKNILVTPEGQVKLLDFGIAKVLSDSRAPAETMNRVMTLQYASPEQILGKPITTASDVYSLGAVLYELLTGGARPYDTTGPLDETIAAVCYHDPARPSTAASPQIAAQLRGELDNIVLRAIAKDPDRRYSSVEQLRDDVRRYRTGLPVLAQGDALSYRFTKLVRRRRALFAAVALIALSVAIGIATTLREARVAQRQRILAERRYNDVRSLATTVLFDIHDNIKNLAGSTQARKLVIDKGLHYLEALARDSEGDAGLQAELAAGYERAGGLVGSYFDSNTEGGRAAAPILQKALLLRKKLVAQKPNDIEANAALGMSFVLYGNSQMAQGDFKGAVASYRDALALPPATAFVDHPALLRVRERADSSLCNAYPVLGDSAAAIPICEESIRLARKLSTEKPTDKEMAHQWAMNELKLANALRLSDRLAEAVLHFGLSLEQMQELIRENPSDSNLRYTEATTKFYLARALDSLKDPSTLDAYADAVKTLEASMEASPGDTRRVITLGYALQKYSELLHKAGRNKEAEAAYGRGLALHRQNVNKPAAGAVELTNYVDALVKSPFPRLRNPVLALQLAERANEMTKGREPLTVNILGVAYYENGRIEEAIRTVRTALSLLPPAGGPSTGIRKDIESNLARFESGQNSPP